jgi:hypothetical protein
MEINDTLEKGENIYPYNEECDKKLDRIYKMDNWAETFYHIKKGKMKQRFIELTRISEYASFFQGLDYEYGINNCQKHFCIHFFQLGAFLYKNPEITQKT